MPSARRRVLHLIDTGGPGGAETIFLNLVTGLGEHGWDCVPVVPTDDWLAGALRRAGFEPAVMDAMRSFDVGYAAALRRLVREERVALVQTHLLGTAVYGTLATWGTRLPVVSTFHGIADIRATQGLSRLKLRLLGGRRRRLVFVSEPLRAHFLETGTRMAADATRVIPNGIDAELYAPGRDGALRRELSIPEAAPLVGAVGNIRVPKAYDNLLRAFSRVVEAVPEARLVVAGQPLPGLWEDLLELRRSLGLEASAHFLGFREDVPSILKALDVFALSSSDEGFSLVTVQAMATGLPVVVTRSGGPETIVEDGVSGVLVPPSDPGALADGLLRVIETADRGRAMGEVGRDRAVAEFSLARMVERYAALYEDLVGT
jgi:glycosyltransferase involved in cell wall biosynthesis